MARTGTLVCSSCRGADTATRRRITTGPAYISRAAASRPLCLAPEGVSISIELGTWQADTNSYILGSNPGSGSSSSTTKATTSTTRTTTDGVSTKTTFTTSTTSTTTPPVT